MAWSAAASAILEMSAGGTAGGFDRLGQAIFEEENRFWWCVLFLIGAILVGFIIIGLVRRWAKSDSPTMSGGFSLSDLRRLHAEGGMSREELERAEKQVINRVRGDADTTASTRRKPATDLDPTSEATESSPEDTE